MLWQLLQSRAVIGCCTDLPKAVLPLWQPTQLAVTPRWLKFAGDQAIVPWHDAQSCEVWMCAVDLPGAAAPLWQLMQLPRGARCSNRAGIQAKVVWQSAHAVLLAICVDDLPGARTPSWQLAQAPVTPACDILELPLMLNKGEPAAPNGLLAAAVPTMGAVLCARAVALMTVAMVLCAGAAGAGGFCPAPPPQFFGLWQPLQSLPTWWPLGLVVKLVTPKKLRVDRSWH